MAAAYGEPIDIVCEVLFPPETSLCYNSGLQQEISGRDMYHIHEKMSEDVTAVDRTERCVDFSTPKSFKRKASESLEGETSDSLHRKLMAHASPVNTAHDIEKIKSRISSKQEKLRKLKLARTYRTKWETQDLSSDTDVWLTGCRSALLDLRAKFEEKGATLDRSEQLSLDTLVQHLGIDKHLIGLDAAEDCFI